jgi:GNAT superfamily N-acetyltransferase
MDMAMPSPFFSIGLPPWLPALQRPMALRIDVARPVQPDADEFESLYDRLHTPGDRLFGLQAVPLGGPEFVVRQREADGELYVYVEDTRRRRLAGYTTFNRLVEVDRRTDPHVRAPHSRYDAPYQRRGLATAVYQRALDAGLCLVSGARQSPGAHALWQRLARQHELAYVDLRDKRLRYLGPQVSARVLDALHTRMLLLGQGWTLQRLAAATGMC